LQAPPAGTWLNGAEFVCGFELNAERTLFWLLRQEAEENGIPQSDMFCVTSVLQGRKYIRIYSCLIRCANGPVFNEVHDFESVLQILQ
jgi:hypothetical protein